MEIILFPCLMDNYGFLIHDPETGLTATVDTPDGQEIARQCETRGWNLTHIWNTHHHPDHTGGNLWLKSKYDLTIVGPGKIPDRIAGLDISVSEGDVFQFGAHQVHVYETPGHTKDHIIFHVPDAGAAFVGDTIFVMGCGRLFEGTPAQMFDSMKKIAALPDETRLYCAHEYTLSNGRYAVTAEPDNQALHDYIAKAEKLRNDDIPTVPTTVEQEKRINPFMRAASAEILGQRRSAKDNFRG